jgi:hypothetical protein
MTRSAKTGPAGAATDSALDTPPDRQPGPSAAAPPAGPAAAIVAALTAAPGGTAAQLARAAGITRTAAARELAALEKAGRATRDRTASPATWTARDVPDEAPGPDSPDSLPLPHGSSIAAPGTAAQDTQGQDAGDPGREQEDAGSAALADPAGTAPGADEALAAAAAATAQAQAALQAGDLAGARGHGGCCARPAVPAAAGWRPGRRPASCATWSPRTWPPTRPRTSARTRSAGCWAGPPARSPTPWTA